MGLIVKPGEKPPESVSRSSDRAREVAITRAKAHEIVRKVDKWEELKTVDIPQELLDYVCQRISSGAAAQSIRRELGIARQSSPAWKKIMSAVRAGRRVDGPALLEKMAFDYVMIRDKLVAQIKKAFDEGVQVATKDGDIVTLHGPTKELNGAIDALNKLNQGFVKVGQDLGAYMDPSDSNARGGVTVVVQNNIPRASKEDIEAHHRKIKGEQAVLIQGQNEKQKPEA